jgi:hypothetical protein
MTRNTSNEGPDHPLKVQGHMEQSLTLLPNGQDSCTLP